MLAIPLITSFTAFREGNSKSDNHGKHDPCVPVEVGEQEISSSQKYEESASGLFGPQMK
jgi:hypothetical protein